MDAPKIRTQTPPRRKRWQLPASARFPTGRERDRRKEPGKMGFWDSFFYLQDCFDNLIVALMASAYVVLSIWLLFTHWQWGLPMTLAYVLPLLAYRYQTHRRKR